MEDEEGDYDMVDLDDDVWNWFRSGYWQVRPEVIAANPTEALEDVELRRRVMEKQKEIGRAHV